VKNANLTQNLMNPMEVTEMIRRSAEAASSPRPYFAGLGGGGTAAARPAGRCLSTATPSRAGTIRAAKVSGHAPERASTAPANSGRVNSAVDIVTAR
jgi:hypothetical protein